MTDPTVLASIAAAAAIIGPFIYDAIKMLADKGVAEPITQPLRDWLRRGYDQKKDDEALHQAILNTLSKIEPASDQWENTLAAIKLTGLTASQAKLLAAAAVEMRVKKPDDLPKELLDALNIDASRRDLLTTFLFELREQLAHSKLPQYCQAIEYADRQDSRGQLHGLIELTLAQIELSERRLSIDEAMIKAMHLATDDSAALKVYMETVREQWSILPLPLLIRTVDPGIKQTGLKQVYVPLTLRYLQAEKQAGGKAGKSVPKKEKSPNEANESISLGGLLNSQARFILLGKPGCGKSTLLRRIALAFAEGYAAQDLSWQGRLLLPIFVRLRNFSVYLEEHRAECSDPLPGALVAYLDHYYRGDTGMRLSLTPDFFDRRLEKGECIVLLDGLDEVSTNRTEVAQFVNTFITHYALKGNHIGLASRPAGFKAVKSELTRSNLVPMEVNPLDPSGIRTLINPSCYLNR